ncbi:MAG TPA: SpoIIE family protein phosphatase [Blastocatellia bacterium]|nr:SpoIIE family protein phosphatase [Blastocatellia bacterium]
MRSKLLSPQIARRVWLLLLILSPLAYAAGLTLFRRYNAEMQIPITLDRTAAIAKARAFATSKGIDTHDWQAFVATESSPRLFYYKMKGPSVAAQLAPLAPIATLNVLLLAPDSSRNIEVYISTDGHVLGYHQKFKEAGGVLETNEATARQMALQTLQARPEANLIPPATLPRVTEDRINGAIVRRYLWKWQHTLAPELNFETTVSVRGQQVIGETLTASLEEQFRNQLFGDSQTPIIVSAGIYFLLALVVIIFGIFRFAERLRQKEVSYLRILLIALSVTAAFGGFVLLADVTVYQAAVQLSYNQAAALSRVFGFITWGFIGLFLGFAYGSGEGDLRELYPGKLASLDALLTGKWHSRNVAQAVIHGAALSGWLFLLSLLLIAPFTKIPGYGWRITSIEPFFSQWPWFSMLLSWPSFGLVSVIFTLLLPLPLLQRRLKKRWLIFGLLFLIAFDANSIQQIQAVRPWGLAMLTTFLAASVMLLAFFKFDVLTAIIALSLADLVAMSYLFLSQSAPGLHRSGVILTQLLCTGLVLALWAYFKGRLYREDEVRPMYAGYLAERLSLQAEVSAAREAQIRLLPDKLPEVRQLAVAAVCQPAHEVGGDFYDLYELEPGKLGIFMAEGGGRGLPAALTIAFAKGFLMPKIKSEKPEDNSPTEIVRGLQTQLMRTMAQDEVMGFIYAVVDTSDHTLRYAGLGNFPRPLVNAHNGTTTPQGEENEIHFRLEGERSFRVTEGICNLEQGDTVSLLSDGAVKMLNDETQRQAFWKRVGNQSDSSYRLRDALAEAFHESARRKTHLEDDLTAVMVQLRKTGGTK